MEMFSDPVTTESTFHSADSIETIARSLSRNIHSSEVIDSRRVRGDSFSALGLDESDSVFSSGKLPFLSNSQGLKNGLKYSTRWVGVREGRE